MSMERAIEHGKEHRRRYYDSRRFDWSCKNHGSCPWCWGNRAYQRRREDEAAMSEIEDYEREGPKNSP